ncbi:MAG: OmpA family protein [Hyphomicrobiaceae bacterium]
MPEHRLAHGVLTWGGEPMVSVFARCVSPVRSVAQLAINVSVLTAVAASAAFAGGEGDRWVTEVLQSRTSPVVGHTSTIANPDAESYGRLPDGPRDIADQSDDTAAATLGVAESYFKLGDDAAGRRTLEVLVARFPDTPEAEHARARLAYLYATTSTQAFGITRFALGGPVPNPGTAAGSADDRPSLIPGISWVLPIAQPLGEQFRQDVADRIFFAAFSSELGQRTRAILDAQAQWLTSRPEARVIIEAFGDEADAYPFNDEFARQRAQAVRDYLVAGGVAENRITINAAASAAGLGECSTADCRARNRRAVTIVTN